MSAVDTVEVVDIEDGLTNDEGHFRSCHYQCTKKVIPGMILEANCGKLYRTTGRVMPIVNSRCVLCIKAVGTRPCPVCGEGAGNG